MLNSLWPHGLQQVSLPCPSLSPRVCSNSCPLCWWCHPTISSSVSLFSWLQSFPASRSFPMSQRLASGGQSYWRFSFSITPSNEYSGLISSRIDWFDLLAVQGTLKSLLQHHNLKALILQCSTFFMVQLTSIRDYWIINCWLDPVVKCLCYLCQLGDLVWSLRLSLLICDIKPIPHMVVRIKWGGGYIKPQHIVWHIIDAPLIFPFSHLSKLHPRYLRFREICPVP